MADKQLNPHILGQLLLLQSALINLPDKESIFSFVCKGLLDVPGVTGVNYYEKKPEHGSGLPSFMSIPVLLRGTYYGELVLSLSDPKLFNPYKEYVNNFVFMIGVILEERNQGRINKQHREQSGQQILEHTLELDFEKENLNESQQYFTDLMRNVKLLSVMLDINGCIIYCNNYLLTVTQYTKNEIMGKDWFELFIPKRKKNLLKQIFLEGIRGKGLPDNLENEILTKTGERLIILWNNTLLRDSGKQIIGTASIGENITERKLAEEAIVDKNKQYELLNDEYISLNKELTRNLEQLQEANTLLEEAKVKAEESDCLKTAFLQNISHEIRTPMNSIIGFSGFLNNKNLSPEKLKRYSEIIIRSSQQLLSIITDIVHIATIEAGKEKIKESIVELNALCKILYQQYSLKANKLKLQFYFRTDLSDDKAIIKTDETKLTEILNNLIGNALKFTKQGSINFGYLVKENNLEFFVEDTGIGIPIDMQEQIFIRFRQVANNAIHQFGGSGLGLSISKAYVEMLGGKIWVISEPGKGSKFYFTIPYKKASTNDLTKSFLKELSPGSESPLTILVAEDEDTNYFLIEEILSVLNLNIIRAVNGIEAVEISKSNPVDLILMDIKMPEMDGLEATKQIKKILPDIPIIAQTAYYSAIDKKNALACGCSDFISKPLNKEQLISVIRNLLLKTNI